ncbi:MAG: flagellar hook-basal body protein [Proteobacteria bacterium]|nr:flagellar hook-basal body protein [Pseudomonadota bacterium]
MTNAANLLRTKVGSLAQEYRLNIISNNVANANTPGFKRDVPVFEGFIVKATKTHFEQGPIEFTGNKLDLALQGPGFFQIETENGVRYTRNGTFTVNSAGQIVNLDGQVVVGSGRIPEETVDLVVNEDGTIMADGTDVGRLEIVEFEDTSVLKKEGYNNFATKNPDVRGAEPEKTTVSQGCVEKPNFNVVEEMVNMIDTIRTFESFQKVILSFEEADQRSINEVGRLI